MSWKEPILRRAAGEKRRILFAFLGRFGSIACYDDPNKAPQTGKTLH
jgi:hypothetical protein